MSERELIDALRDAVEKSNAAQSALISLLKKQEATIEKLLQTVEQQQKLIRLQNAETRLASRTSKMPTLN